MAITASCEIWIHIFTSSQTDRYFFILLSLYVFKSALGGLVFSNAKHGNAFIVLVFACVDVVPDSDSEAGHLKQESIGLFLLVGRYCEPAGSIKMLARSIYQSIHLPIYILMYIGMYVCIICSCFKVVAIDM